MLAKWLQINSPNKIALNFVLMKSIDMDGLSC
jgi:hypothetical protein